MSDKDLATQNDFVSWMIRSERGVEGLIVSILYVIVVAGKNITDVDKLAPFISAHKKIVDSLPSIFQCLALLPALWQCGKVGPPDALRANHGIAARACDQFAKSLTALVAVWIFFYFFVFLWQIRPIDGMEPWTDLLNNMQAVFLFLCYWTLTAITVPEPGSEYNERKGKDSMSLALVLNFSLWIVTMFFLADMALWKSKFPGNRFWVQSLSGLAVGVCIALLAGCLESEYLDAPWTRLLTACFYCYAVLQLAYVGFNFKPDPKSADMLSVEKFLEQFATITSLPLKLLLIGFCFWAIREGRLAFYMEKNRNLIRNVPAEWDQFQNSIREGGDKAENALGQAASGG